MSETVLITGGRGFVGSYLVAALEARWPDWRLITLNGPSGGQAPFDVADTEAVDKCIEAVKPSIVVHLAAVSAVTASLLDPEMAWRVNLWGTLNIVQALQRHAPSCHLLFVSSAEVYGRSLAMSQPVSELALLEPVNPYAASKASADILVRQAAASGLSATIARPFNHTGAGQSEAFALPSFAAQIARIEQGLQPPVLSVGSLDDERDFLDVQDVVAAYVDMLDARASIEAKTVFNVASGQAHRIGDLLDRLLSLATVKIEVQTDPARIRPQSVRSVVGDASRLRAALGWTPRHNLDDTLLNVLNAQRASIRG